MGPLQPAAENAIDKNLHSFSQSRYVSSNAMMAKKGAIYIPKSCEGEQAACALVVALHGCGQAPKAIGPVFAEQSGYNQIAESNGVVVLYPAVEPSLLWNSAGCWDWWGYTDRSHFLDKEAPQIKAIMAMVHQLVDGPKSNEVATVKSE